MTPLHHMTDRELLVQIATNVENLSDKLGEHVRDTKADIQNLWAKKADKSELAQFAGHGRRIASLEKYVWMGVGGIALLEIAHVVFK